MNLWRNRSQLSEQCEYVVPVVHLPGANVAEKGSAASVGFHTIVPDHDCEAAFQYSTVGPPPYVRRKAHAC